MKTLTHAVGRCAVRSARLCAASAALALCMLTTSVDANPSGGVVTHGDATINYGANMTINIGSSNVIINWDHFGIGAGGAPTDFHFFDINYQEGEHRERMREAIGAIKRLWTEEDPFEHNGKFWQFKVPEPMPHIPLYHHIRPYQDPHPPIWVPSQGSSETIEWAAHPDRKYTYLQTYSPFQNVVRFHNAYRDVAHRHGYTATSEQLGWAAPIYVGETDQQAIDEVRPHVELFFNKLLRYSISLLLPPGAK